MLDWLIIGGGLHGVHLAARLVGEGRVDPASLAILDPETTLLARWRHLTANTGMSYLRSPVVHHLDLHPLSLRAFAGKRASRRRKGLFTAPYQRPALSLFNAHCEHVLSRYRLRSCHVSATAHALTLWKSSVTVETTAGGLHARRVVLALGPGGPPKRPSWSEQIPQGSIPVSHVFDADFDMQRDVSGDAVVVVGGGISAIQAALHLAATGRTVSLVSRHAVRVHQFDSDPGWLGKFLPTFHRLQDSRSRRHVIASARHRGSVPLELSAALQHAVKDGRIRSYQGEVTAVRPGAGYVQVDVDGAPIVADFILHATGFLPTRPGGRMIEQLIGDHALPCGECGYPIPDRNLQWTPHLHVIGSLAELELGPAARNIAGARMAASRILAAPAD